MGEGGEGEYSLRFLFTEHLQQVGLFHRVSRSLIFTLQEKLSSPSEDTGLGKPSCLSFRARKLNLAPSTTPRVLPSVLP